MKEEQSKEIKKEIKKRGRPSGTVAVHFVGVNYANKFAEKVYSPLGLSREEVLVFSMDDAKKLFKETFNMEADIMFGPSYDMKGPKSSKKEQSEVVTTAVSALNSLAGSLGNATHDEWRGPVFEIEGRDDVVFFLPLENLSSNINRNKPNAKSIAKAELTFNN